MDSGSYLLVFFGIGIQSSIEKSITLERIHDNCIDNRNVEIPKMVYQGRKITRKKERGRNNGLVWIIMSILLFYNRHT